MLELLIPFIIIGAWTYISITYVKKFKEHQIDKNSDKKSIWNNQYIFDNLEFKD